MSDQEKLRMCKEEISKIRDRIKKEIQEKDRKMKKELAELKVKGIEDRLKLARVERDEIEQVVFKTINPESFKDLPVKKYLTGYNNQGKFEDENGSDADLDSTSTEDTKEIEIKLEILALEKQRTCNVKNVRDLEKELSDAKEALTKLNEGEIAQDNDIPMDFTASL
ncbi:uncharacterized protein LOC110858798 isoform X2 [Folsomia candida]|uniref:uncharacterized protein LOC110858798 isoform X2 n=1 Tax=Folsomia candida TaxID=158441 RepID=UPI000B8F8E57|nr:uncharacterized protein LOC110858798 isoform X2 [Folsomia candida]